MLVITQWIGESWKNTVQPGQWFMPFAKLSDIAGALNMNILYFRRIWHMILKRDYIYICIYYQTSASHDLVVLICAWP